MDRFYTQRLVGLVATIPGNPEAIDHKAELLIQAALKTVGQDNMTIVLARV